MRDSLLLTVFALWIEAMVGYPPALYAAIRHPVVWIGAGIAALDRRLNDPPASRLVGGAALAVILVAVALAAGSITVLARMTLPPRAATVLLAVLASTLLAQRSLGRHVADVAAGLRRGLAEGRAAVAHIVGRDPQTLDEHATARAAIESLAENFSDGVVAPAFWGALAGLPGMAVYKAANTADSMIGHYTPRHERFGWAAARFDDGINLPASRLAALWLIVAALVVPGCSARGAWRAVWRDARHHRSPNAGWPEAAMAGALGLRLAGPRVYAGVRVADGWMGDGRAEATPRDIDRALLLYRLACLVQIGVLAALAFTWPG